MKKQIAKSALMVAAVMGALTFSSCKEKENGIDPDLGKEIDVTIGVKMAARPGASLKAATSADDLNMGSAIQTINNIVIVPFSGANVGNNIVYGTYVSTTDASKYITTTIPQSTNMFRVYGNLSGTFSSDAVFAMPDLSLSNSGFSAGDQSLTGVYPAHPLYYFVEAVGAADAESTGFKVGTGSTAGDWATVASNAPTEGKVGTNNRVAITKSLRYAVGALAAAVLDGVEGDNLSKTMFTKDGEQSKSWNDLKGSGGITIEGIVIEGQSINFDAQMKPTGTEVKVYGEAVTKTLATSKITNENGKVSGANIYSVVAPEDASTIVVNFQFKNGTGYNLLLNDETPDNTDNVKIANGGYFYMATPLRRDAVNDKDIFAAFTSTILNATVTDWGKASATPVETTEVELGITVDTNWEVGLGFDVEL